jgi:putative AlgH/UPF0301 family transcriptional regulator
MRPIHFTTEASMKRTQSFLGLGITLLIAIIPTSAVAQVTDLSEPVLLVASSLLDRSPFEQAVVIAAPRPDGGHIGFVLNRRTTVKLETLFPDEAAVTRVLEPVYVGGAEMPSGVFAVTREAPQGAHGMIVPLMPGLVAALDRDTVDRIIATMPNDARYFVGLMLWDPEELEGQVAARAWEVRPADADVVLTSRPSGLWQSLHGTWL